MSTFQGLIDEFSGISVDNFENHNWNSSIYFLSHVHSDHTRGLSSCLFQNHLVQENRIVYSHEVSMAILRRKYPAASKQFQYLPLHVPNTMQTFEGVQFSVTLLLAGHCPGSVMFLFENDKSRVLYTGDFRLNIAEFKMFKGLYTPQGDLKRINKIHLDTTFMLRRYEKFPSRDESINTLLLLITEWLDMDESHEINLTTGYYYGAEYILERIYETFQIAVHVCPESYNAYKYFPNMDKCVTESAKTRIHFNCISCGSCCKRNGDKIRSIKLSALIWNDWHDGNNVQTKVSSKLNSFRVCYSTHASLQEIRDLLDFLKPEKVEPSVEHPEESDLNETLSLIEEYTQGNSPIKTLSPKLCFERINKHNSDDKLRLCKRGREDCSDESDNDEVCRLRAIRHKMKEAVKVKRDLSLDLYLSD